MIGTHTAMRRRPKPHPEVELRHTVAGLLFVTLTARLRTLGHDEATTKCADYTGLGTNG